jgi:hypothetical protein
MLPGDFMFANRFNGLPAGAIEEAISYIEVNWAGIQSLWQYTTSPTLRDDKRRLCTNYLVAWYLADMYPTTIQGVFNQNGAPIKSKNIGGTDISFNERKVQAELVPLTTNIFGMRALDMIINCPDRFLLR